MKLTDEFIDKLCNELAQPVTVLTLTIQLIEEGAALPEDVALLKSEIERLALMVRDLRARVDQQYEHLLC